MLNVSEITGAFTIPYGISISHVIWDVVNQMGIYLIPYVFIIWKSILDARAQGRDEGSPAILSIKTLEMSSITMFILMYLFVMPWTPATPTLDFEAYSCRGPSSSVLGTAATTTNIQPTLTYYSGATNNQLPIGLGLFNQFANGTTNTLIGMMPCDSGFNTIKNQASMATLGVEEEPALEKMAKLFYEQCYVPATDRLDQAIINNSYNSGVPLTAKQTQYSSLEYFSAYQDLLASVPSPNPLKLSMPASTWNEVPDFTISASAITSTSDPSEVVTSCYTASEQMTYALESWLDDNRGEALDLAKTTESAYLARDGSAVTDTTVMTKYIHQSFIDTAVDMNKMFRTTKSSILAEEKGFDSYEEAIVRTLTITSELEKNVSNQTLSLLAPIIISAMIAIVYCFGPLIIILSGYSATAVSAICYLVAWLLGCFYVIDVAWYVENVILALVQSQFNAISSDPNMSTSMIFSYAQSTVMFTMLGAWTAVGTMLGVNAIPALSGLIGSVATNVGQSGVAVAATIGKQLANIATAGAASTMKQLGNQLKKALNNKFGG